MAKIKIVSNPYNQEINYFKWNEVSESWSEINYENNPNSKLLNDNYVKGLYNIIDDVLYDEEKSLEKLL